MASPAEIANDLEARSRLLKRTQMQDHGNAMKRGADAIRALLTLKAELEAFAEAEAQRFDQYREGVDLVVD